MCSGDAVGPGDLSWSEGTSVGGGRRGVLLWGASEGGGLINALSEHFYKDSLERALIEPPSEPLLARPLVPSKP